MSAAPGPSAGGLGGFLGFFFFFFFFFFGVSDGLVGTAPPVGPDDSPPSAVVTGGAAAPPERSAWATAGQRSAALASAMHARRRTAEGMPAHRPAPAPRLGGPPPPRTDGQAAGR